MKRRRGDSVITGQVVTEGKMFRAKQLRRNQTEAEELLWQMLRRGQLQGMRFRRQQVIDGFIADFYCHAARLVVEVDSPSHREQAGYDVARDRIIAAWGLRVIRVTNDEVLTDPFGTAHRIAAAALDRAMNQSNSRQTRSDDTHRDRDGDARTNRTAAGNHAVSTRAHTITHTVTPPL